MRQPNLYLWGDYLLTKKELKKVLDKDEWKEFWSNPKDCKECKRTRLLKKKK